MYANTKSALPLGLLCSVAFACRASPDVREPAAVDGEAQAASPKAVAGPRAQPTDCAPEMNERASCGVLTVYENRDTRVGRTIDLAYAVVPATSGDAKADPVFVLAGGPGQAATQITSIADNNLKDVNRTRDLVFVDQRGTGASNGLQCLPEDLELLLAGLWSEGAAPLLAECTASYDADLSQYGTPVAMDDLEDLRVALGYEQINVWGGSYGTRAALVYARRHPEHLRSMVLWGVAPPHQAFPATFAPAGQAALDALFAACAADEACAPVLPDGAATVKRITDKLASNPARVQVVDPRTGEPAEIAVTPQIFLSGVRFALYDAGWAANLPGMLAAADKGDFAPLMSLLVPLTVAISTQIHFGMFMSVACGEDVARLDEADVHAATATFLGPAMVTDFQRACAGWTPAPAPAGYAKPVASDVPTLLMAGEIDPVTPPSTAQAAAQTLSRSRVVAFPHVSHSTSNASACEASLTAAFFETPDPKAVDPACTQSLQRPPFPAAR